LKREIDDIKKLKKKQNCIQEEILKLSEQFDECIKEHTRLSEVNRTLELDLRCTKSKIVDEKFRACRLEKKFKFEQEMLSTELKIKCKKLNDTEMQYDETNVVIDDGKCKIKYLTMSLKELKEMNEKCNDELKIQIQKLEGKNRSKNDNMCRLKKKIEELQRESYEKECPSKFGNW